MNQRRPFRLGVNYWPARHAMGFWKNWNEVELDEDFVRMKGAGLDTVRVFLTWEDFQPSPGLVDPRMLDLLTKTLDRAGVAGLGVMPTLFTGHMSGANWLPGWALGGTGASQRFPIVSAGRLVRATPRNWYSDATILGAQVLLAGECASAVASHPALVAWDLGNENSNCTVPAHREHARAWLRATTDAIRARDPRTKITIGIHMEDLEEDRLLGPREAAEACDFLTMHGYPGYASFTQGPTDERLLPFLAQLTRFLGGGKDVLFSEFGVPTLPPGSASNDDSVAGDGVGPALVTEAEAARYVGRSLRALQECGASGAMLWCHSDYCPELFELPPFDDAPHERSFGMFHADRSAKPVVQEVAAFSREEPEVAATPRVDDLSFIDVLPEDYYEAPKRNLVSLFQRYCERLSEPLPFEKPINEARSGGF